MTNTPPPAKDIDLIQRISAELVTRLSQGVAPSTKSLQPAPKPTTPAPQPEPDAHRPVQMGAAEKSLQHFLSA